MRRHAIVTTAAVVALLLVIAPAAVADTTAPALPNDFNGDGYADLAVGAVGESVGTKLGAGAVNVLYGGPKGLTASGDQFWSQQSKGIEGQSKRQEHFGAALASGDFDSDGYEDLAIGIPFDRLGHDEIKAGAVAVLYGSANGLTAAGDQPWSEANPPGSPERYDQLGAALAAGDFDGDGYADLAIGVPTADIGTDADAGLVQVLFGGGDGVHDLAIGAPPSHLVTVGEVAVFYGAAGDPFESHELWAQDAPGVDDSILVHDRFGAALAIGDFDADEDGDLAIGTPNIAESIGAAGMKGKVIVLPASRDGLTTQGSQVWPSVVGGYDDTSSEFGTALAAADFDGDLREDLAIGAPYADYRDGAVHVLYGSTGGLDDEGATLWTQDGDGVPGTSEDYDRFGAAVTGLDLDASGAAELVIGAPGEETAKGSEGRVTVILGGSSGLVQTGIRAWSQDTEGVNDAAERWDEFGSTLVGSPGQ